MDFRCDSAQFGRSTKSGRVGGRKKDDHNDNGQDGEILRRGGSPDAQGCSRELVSVILYVVSTGLQLFVLLPIVVTYSHHKLCLLPPT